MGNDQHTRIPSHLIYAHFYSLSTLIYTKFVLIPQAFIFILYLCIHYMSISLCHLESNYDKKVASKTMSFLLTGLAQCSELCWQLRGKADKRQVPGAKVALQHNLGLGGAAVVTIYKMGFRGNDRK